MLGKFGGGGDLIPSALRWLRRRGGVDEGETSTESTGATGSVQVDAILATATEGTSAPTVVPEVLGMASEEPVPIGAAEPLPTADDVPDLRALVEANKNDPKLRWQLGLALVAARKLNLALAHLEVAASQDPSLDQGELGDVRELQRAER